MSQHMVIFQNPDGDPGYNQFESIEGAVGFVEKLRNEQGIESIRIFELDEVKFDLKPIYKVELQALNPGSSAPTTAPASVSSPAPAPAPPSSPPPSPSGPAPASAEPPSGSPFAPPSQPSASEPAPAPAPPADQPAEDDQPARRGLFGR